MSGHENVVGIYLRKMMRLLAKPKHDFSKVSLNEVPKSSGVYAIYDKKLDKIVYVGRTKNLKRRLLGYHKRGNIEGSQFRKALGRHLDLSTENEITRYITEKCSFQFIQIQDFEEIVRFEHFIIAIIAPILNVKLRQ